MEALAKSIPTELIEYNITDVAIQALDEKYQGMGITDGKSYKAVVDGIGEIRAYRVQVEAKRKELKADALAFGRKVDGEAKRITELLVPIEYRLKSIKKVEDDRKAAIKAEKERIEQERVDSIQVKIIKIISMGANLGNLNVDQLNTLISDIFDVDITSEEYQEYDIHAQQAKDDALEATKSALVERAKLDQEAAERKAEGERFFKMKVAQEAEAKRLKEIEAEIEAKRQAELQRLAEIEAEIEAARQKVEDEKAQLEADKKAEQDRREQAVREDKIKEEAQAQAIRDAETKRVQEEKDKIALEKAEAEENARQRDLKPDKEKLLDFAGVLEDLELPKVKDGKAKAVITEAKEALTFTAQTIREEVEEL